jgi:uncharacterized protein DUF4446
VQDVGELTSTAGIVALIACVIAVITLWAAGVTHAELRRLRAAQRVVLGPGDARDVVAHVADLERSFQALRQEVDASVGGFDARIDAAERGVGRAIALRGLVHYDAYHEVSGRHSSSIALLDGSGSGVVLSAIHLRDQARIYAKEVVGGRAELQLSPEEEEAVRIALAAPAGLT